MALPLSKVFQLRISTPQKVALAALFTVGILYSAMEIARLLFVHYSTSNLAVVSATLLFNPIQSALAVAVGCAPILKPLLFRRKRSPQGSSATNSWRVGSKTGSSAIQSHASEAGDTVPEMRGLNGMEGFTRRESDIPISECSLDFASLEEVRSGRSFEYSKY